MHLSLSLSPPPICYNSVLLIMIHISLISLIIVSAGGVVAIVLPVTRFKELVLNFIFSFNVMLKV